MFNKQLKILLNTVGYLFVDEILRFLATPKVHDGVADSSALHTAQITFLNESSEWCQTGTRTNHYDRRFCSVRQPELTLANEYGHLW